jgi:hypothetical protein
LNNVSNLLFKKITDDSELLTKKIKIFIDAFGLDKFHQKKSMLSNFGVEVTYQLV